MSGCCFTCVAALDGNRAGDGSSERDATLSSVSRVPTVWDSRESLEHVLVLLLSAGVALGLDDDDEEGEGASEDWEEPVVVAFFRTICLLF